MLLFYLLYLWLSVPSPVLSNEEANLIKPLTDIYASILKKQLGIVVCTKS